jgi:hypothetical protein
MHIISGRGINQGSRTHALAPLRRASFSRVLYSVLHWGEGPSRRAPLLCYARLLSKASSAGIHSRGLLSASKFQRLTLSDTSFHAADVGDSVKGPGLERGGDKRLSTGA